MKNKQELFNISELFKNIVIGIIVNIVTAIILNFFISRALWILVVSILPIILFSLIGKRFERTIKFIRAGGVGYYYSFDLDENPRIWQNIEKSFCYLGISFDSIMEYFRMWTSKKPISSYKILLMKPNSLSLLKQEAFQRGYDIDVDFDKLSSEERNTIECAANVTSRRIESAIEILKNTILYKEGQLQVRLYDEFIPWWLYFFDDKVVYVGILEKGKRGSSSPVLIAQKKETYTGIYDAFKNYWNRIWENSDSVNARKISKL